MKRRKWMLLTFHAVDYRSIPLFLERQEKRGWQLKRILWPWIGLFVPAETQSRYAADLFPSDALGDEEKRAEYLRLCADAGWDYVGRLDRAALFRARPGRAVVPLQTDPALEKRQIKEGAVKPVLWAAAVLVFNMVLQTLLRAAMGETFYWFELFLSGPALLLAAGLLLLAADNLILCGYALHALRRTAPALPERARLWKGLELLFLLLLAAVLIVGLAAGGGEETVDLEALDRPPYTTGQVSTPLETFVEKGPGLEKVWTIESLEEGISYTKRYDARWTWLAEAAFDQLARQADRDKTRQVACGNGTGTPEAPDLPGTEHLLLRYQRGTYLILRQGKTVLCVAGTADWSDQRNLDRLAALLAETDPPCIGTEAVVG